MASMICGIQALRGDPGAAALDAMVAALPGRRTDATAAWTTEAARLGWRGHEAADGAACCARGGAGDWVVASARIDGRDELRAALGVSERKDEPLTDAELILRAWRKWGAECPQRLYGDYAFAAWDAERRRLLLARDHIGARALYYAAAADRIVFASDVNAVLAAPGVEADLDEDATASWLARHIFWPFGERTFHRAVRRLPPGHLLLAQAGGWRVRRWWHPERIPALGRIDDGEAAEACLALCAAAVADRAGGPRRVGVHLSGGLDSSCVSALAARALRAAGRPAPPAFTWLPEAAEGSRDAAPGGEYRLVEAVAAQEGLEVHHCPPTAADMLATLRRDVTRHDSYHLNECPVQRSAAAQGVGVLLSGWGGDEGVSFSGRGYHPDLLRKGRLAALRREFGHRRFPLLGIARGAALPFVQAMEPVRTLRDTLWRLRQGKTPLPPTGRYLHPDFARRARLLPMPPTVPVAGARAVQLGLLASGYIDRRIEGWAASGARLGIEYRYPLLDRRLLEFVLALPPEQFLRGPESRRLMRRSQREVLPELVLRNRDKTDPARYRAYRDALAETLAQARSMIAGGGAGTARGRYLNLGRLTRDLELLGDFDPARIRRHLRPRPLIQALQFLDF